MRISDFFKTIQYILNHPLNRNSRLHAFIKFIKWQLTCRLNPYPILYSFLENSRLIVHKSMHAATGNLYVGLQDLDEMSFLLHLLRSDDLFCDIGANIGTYTILASKVIGARVISIEPVPISFSRLMDNISINHVNDIVNAYNIGLASSSGYLKFSSMYDSLNHVVNDNDNVHQTIEIKTELLDNILSDRQTLLIKLDVEGYEYHVLRGGINTLKSDSLKAILIELNGCGKYFGIDDSEVHSFLDQFGFKPFKYLPFERELIPLEKPVYNGNFIFCRDLEFIIRRIKSQRKFSILNKYI